MINRPTYINQIIHLIDKDLVKVLVGFRRSGKSILLDLIKQYLIENGRDESQIISINFEDFAYYEHRDAKRLYDYVKSLITNKKKKTYLFFDEIQEVDGFEQAINSLRVSENVDIYITGSNANLLSGELATYLAGRYYQITVFPFSFKEYLSAKGGIEKGAVAKLFLEYIDNGAMPFTAVENVPKQIKLNYLKDIYNSVVLKDIVERNKVRDVELLERTIQFALSNAGQIFSATSISNYLKSQNRKGKTDTLLNYLSYCKDAFLLYPIKRNDLRGKKIFSTNEKYFVVDHGLRTAMIGRAREDIEQVLENIVAMEAIRRGYSVTVGYINNHEIDFVIEKGGEKLYIQVTYLLSSDKTICREFRPLLEVDDNFRKVVVSLDPVLKPQSGVEHKRIEEFLMEENWTSFDKSGEGFE